MSTLTKIFVVLLLLEAFFASVVMIQHVATSQDYKAYAEDQFQKRTSAEAETGNVILALKLVDAQLEAERSTVQDLDKKLTLQRDTSRADKYRLSQALTTSQNSVTALTTRLNALQKSLDMEVKVMRNDMKVELAELRTKSIEDGDRILGLQGLLKDCLLYTSPSPRDRS